MRSLLLIACVAHAGCLDAAPSSDDLADRGCSREWQWKVPLPPRRAVDLLVVVDRTPSMADQAATFALNAPQFGNVLEQIEGGVPDLHVAVVTSDLGGPGVPGCGDGDGARFQGAARCGLDGAFLDVRRRDDGTLAQNYAGTFRDTLTCLLDLPPSTCPVSQPLAAVVRALDGSQPSNDGFRRPAAQLMFLIITDGDECSIIDPAALAGITGATPVEVEAAVDRACFARGATCDPRDPATPGPHTACSARTDAGFASVAASVEALRAGTPQRIMGAIIAGPAEVQVSATGDIASSCIPDPAGPTGQAGAAPRLATLAAALPERFVRADVCSPNWTDALMQLAGGVLPNPGNPCLEAGIDLAPLVPGIQPDCVASLVDAAGATPLPWCADPAAAADAPCLRIVEDAQSCPSAGLAFHVDKRDRVLPPSWLDVRCRLECP